MMFLPQKVDAVSSYKDFQTLIPVYFTEDVIGVRSQQTVLAKTHDLKLFLKYLKDRDGILIPVDQWLPMDTRVFLDDLSRQGYAPATINRVLATIRAFANWLVDHNTIRMNPVKGIKDLQLLPAAPKAIRDREWCRIQRAAEIISMNPEKKYSQGQRNKAILAALNASGLRVSELLNLKLNQFANKKFYNVLCKGGKVSPILISKEAADGSRITSRITGLQGATLSSQTVLEVI
jgi:site-specific recombinase XerD